MKELYNIKNKECAEIILNKEIYPLIAIKKALSNFFNDVYIKIDSDAINIIITIYLKDVKDDIKKVIGEFYNECLRETLRYNISCETKNIRELIVARALYTTCMETDKNEDIGDIEVKEDYNIDDIAVNWFDKYNKEE